MGVWLVMDDSFAYQVTNILSLSSLSWYMVDKPSSPDEGCSSGMVDRLVGVEWKKMERTRGSCVMMIGRGSGGARYVHSFRSNCVAGNLLIPSTTQLKGINKNEVYYISFL